MPLPPVHVFTPDAVAAIVFTRLGCQHSVDQPGDTQRQYGIHVVPQLPLGECPIQPPALAVAEPSAETVEKRVQVIVVDDEYATVRMVAVERFQVPGDLQPHRRLA